MTTEATEKVRIEHQSHISQIAVFPSQRYPGYRAGHTRHTQMVRTNTRKGEILILPCALSFGYLTVKILRKLIYRQ